MLSCLAVDDEPIALEIIQTFADRVPFLDLKATFTNPRKALEFLKTQPVDLIFLDVNMPVINGLEMAEILRRQTSVIFTTAYPEHALKGYELEVSDYLLKPIAFDRFLQASQKVQEARQSRVPAKVMPLFVKDGYEWVSIQPEQVHYLESADNYVKIRQSQQTVLVRSTLPELLEMLPPGNFIRVHRSFVVNMQHVERIGRADIQLPDRQIPIGSSYRSQLEKWL
ncbi:LytTR family DNA-binding domain-containing protein [Siphonobacter sp. SORGH_AS_0500]|uniref:LytR/AlgR family response regulator transcription factor n=1 Tax=Siphonobacter sp. SORGH_AS_0500 TaxID=1864824 RepID=UPI0028559784|nr:LytTR family DNA-binding domain-containing protein [Siphonobacter sp. SORGH_AS_0500]MDR6197423.1 two-component system LytT family response regulator [Siphonobacter sp. SORGH_AS_0500]